MLKGKNTHTLKDANHLCKKKRFCAKGQKKQHWTAAIDFPGCLIRLRELWGVCMVCPVGNGTFRLLVRSLIMFFFCSCVYVSGFRPKFAIKS